MENQNKPKSIQELLERINQLKTDHTTRLIDEKIECCLQLLYIYCSISRYKRTNRDGDACYAVASILAGCRQKGLGKKVKALLAELPKPARNILESNITRMEGYDESRTFHKLRKHKK